MATICATQRCSSAGLKAAGIEMDRKVLAAIAFDDAPSFAAIVEKARAALG